MDVKIKIDGLAEMQKAFAKYPKVTEKFVNQAIYAYSNQVAKTARKNIRTGKRSGNIYSVNGRPHVASSPSEYPARITQGRGEAGGLHGNIGWARTTKGTEIYSNADYSGYLEDGTKYIKGKRTIGGVTFVGGRPFMYPALQENEAYFNEQIDDAIEKAVNIGGAR